MKLRELLTKLNNAIRPPQLAGAPGEGVRPDPEDAWVTGVEGGTAPVGWVPSQQDEGPTHDGGVL